MMAPATAGSMTMTHAPGWLSTQSRLRVLRRVCGDLVDVAITGNLIVMVGEHGFRRNRMRPGRQSNVRRSEGVHRRMRCLAARDDLSVGVAFGGGDGLGDRILAEIVIAVSRVVHRKMLHQRVEYLAVDLAVVEHRIQHVAAEGAVVREEVLVESGHRGAVEHDRREIAEQRAPDIVAQEHRLAVGHLHQCGVGRLLLDDGSRLDKAERAAHDHREEGVGSAVRLDDAVVERLESDV